MTTVEIEYCVPCGFLDRAETLQHALGTAAIVAPLAVGTAFRADLGLVAVPLILSDRIFANHGSRKPCLSSIFAPDGHRLFTYFCPTV
jgi:hypothetical protein